MAEIKINDLTAYTSPVSTDVLPIVDVGNDVTKKVSIADLVALAAVSSVNSQTGTVVLDADNISDTSTTNKFTTAAEATKLAGIETGATADQTAAQIKTAYESNNDTNAFTDASLSKLNGVASGAEVNVNADWNSSSGDSQILNKPTIPAAYTNSDVDAHLNTSSASSNEVLSWSGTDYDWVAQSSGGATNLGVSTTTTAVTVTSDTGTNAAIGDASGSAAGVMSVAHHDKLDGIASSATNVTNTNQLTNGAGFITATLTEEQVEDFVGGMVTGNTETGIAVTYQDADGTLDFVVTSQTDNNFTTTLKNKLDGLPAAAVAASGGTFTGDVEFDGDIAADGVYTGAVTAVAALAIDCSSSNYFTKTINGNSTFTFTNVPATRAFGFTLELTHTSGTVTWPASVKFPADTAPTLTTGKTHIFVFVTDDGGTRFRGAALVDYIN